MMELYKNIKKYRTDLQMTQTELARLAGYADKSMIAKIEAGQIDLPQSKIELFAGIFHVEPGELMGWIEHDDHIQKTNDRTLAYIISMYNLFDENDKSEIIALIRAKEMKYREKEKGYSAS